METVSLSPFLREALIITILKPGKPSTHCDSHRPLSMINVDNKILARLIANCLQPLMAHITRPDQSGFISVKSTSWSLRTIFASLHTLRPNLPVAAMLLDATKVFDSLEWPFSFGLLQRIGLSPRFLRLIHLLYDQ